MAWGLLAHPNQAGFQFLIFQRFELVKNGEEHNWRELRHQHKQRQECRPGDQPPVLRGLTENEIQQLGRNRP